jgi:glycerophosphoryl diester phosphodiesterase
MAAFRAARELGADAVEFDVHATSDGHLVVVHDYDLSRTTSGTGLVHERELAYVRSLSAGAWFGHGSRTSRCRSCPRSSSCRTWTSSSR